MATQGNTTNRITLKIGVLLDDKMAISQGKKIRETYDKEFSESMKRQTKEMQNQNKVLNTATKEVKKQKTFVQELSDGWAKTLANYAKFTIITTVLMSVTVALKRAKDLMYELDTAMTNLSIVTNATSSELAMVDKTATELTSSLGALKNEVINSVTEFARAGYDIADSLLLAENATKAANVGFTELENVTTFVIAGLKSFKLEAEDSARVLDVLFRVSNITAIDLEGIGEAFLRSANTLKVAGATLEQSAALISAANESIQDPAKVGTALKTIASRLRGISEEGEVVPSLAEDFRNVGVEIQNADGSFRNIYDVFEEFSEVYKTLDDLTKESLLEKLAGKRQKNIMIGLLENFDVAQMAFEEAIDSAGSVAQANEKYLNSLEGKTKILTETYNEFLRSLTNSDAFKVAIDGLTQIIKLIQFIISGSGSFIGAIGGITTAVIGFGSAVSIAIPIVGAIVGGFALVNTAFNLFGDKTDEIATKVGELNSKISDLQSKISNLKQAGVDASDPYLKSLERQLEIENELLKLQEKKLVESNIKTARKAYNELITVISDVTDEYNMFKESLNEDDLDRFNEWITESQSSLLAQRYALEQSREAFSESDDEYKLLTEQILEFDEALQSSEDLLVLMGIKTLPKLSKEINQTKNAQQKLNETINDAKSLVSGISDGYDILTSALGELETQGYLSDDTLQTLLLTYPDIIEQTGLAADAVRDYAKAEKESTDAIILSKIELLKVQKSVFEEQIALYEESMRLLAYDIGTNDELMYAAQFALSSGIISNAKAAVANANNSIAILENSLKKSPFSTTGGSKTSAEKEIEQLSELERALRDINYQIDVQQKLYSRAEGTAEQIEINEKLIELYKKQRDAIREVRREYELENQGIKKSDEGYDDYIDTLQKFSLQVEDATNNIFELTNANNQMRMTAIESVNELRDLITKLVEQELKDEIDKNKELIEHAKEQLDIKLKQLEAEKELADFSKDRAKQEQNIAKITSKIESLRVAASQGDARAINEINQLEEQRAELQENLDEAINERSFELRKENLQNQFDEFERIKNEEIKLLEDQLNDAGRIIELANKKMSDALANNMGSLYQELVNWNSVYGTGFENDVLSKWEKAIGLVQQYNSVIGGSGFNFGDFQSSGGTVGSKLEQVKAEMRRNSDLWWQTEDADEKRRLNERNKALAKSIGYSYNPGDGRYYSDKDGSMLVYDNGGYKPKGVSGFMAEGVEEWVLKDGQIKAMQEMAMESLFNRYGLKTPSFDGSSSFGDINVNIYGDISDNNVEKIRTDLKDVVREVSRGQLDSFKTMGYVPKVKIR